MQISVTSGAARKSFTPSTSYWYSRKSLPTAASALSLMVFSVPCHDAGEVDVLRDIDRQDRALVDRYGGRAVCCPLHGLVGQLLDCLRRVAFERGLGHDAIADGGGFR